jgi:hypothetical protein
MAKKLLNQQFEDIARNLQEDPDMYIFKSIDNKRAVCWTKYQFLCDSNGNHISSEKRDDSVLIICKDCKKVNTFKKGQGTTNLNEHVVKCPVKDDPLKFGRVSNEEKEIMKTSLVRYVSNDMKSFLSVAKNGFIGVVQCAIDLQAKRKDRMNARQLLSHPNTISKAVGDQAVVVKELVIDQMQAVISDGVIPAFSIDFWKAISNEVFPKSINCNT